MTAVVGVLLIVLGVATLVFEGITYTRTKTLIDIGPVRARVEERRTIPLPPILGIVAVAGGILVLVMGARTRTV
jgi:hypothetical protein